MELTAAALSDVGRTRTRNEDSCYAGTNVFAVADGLGGHIAGEVASSLALEPLKELDARPPREAFDKIADAVRRGNRAVFDRAMEDTGLKGMGTTMTAVALHEGTLHLAHVGDSRAYLLRDGSISQLSRDHTLVARMVDEGKLTQEQAEAHPQRSILTRALGAERDVEVEESEIALLPGDRVLLCSDGLTAVLADEDIRRLAQMEQDAQQACRVLIDEANARGGPDNITTVVIDVAGEFGAPVVATAGGRAPRRRESQRRFPVRLVVWLVLLAVLIGGGLFTVRSATSRSYYVGVQEDGRVTIFKGLPVDVAGFALSEPLEPTDLTVEQVATDSIRRSLEAGIRVDSLDAARRKVTEIKEASGIEPGPSPPPSPDEEPSR